jgi:opacity protein-like surface antigen
VKKNCNEVSYMGYLLSALIVFVIIGSIISYSYGEEEKKNTTWGFSILGGTGDAVYTKTDVKVYGFLPRISLPLYKKWKNWYLEFEGNFFYYDIHKMHDFYFLGVSHNILFKPIEERWGALFLLVGGGLGYDNAGKRLKRGDSDAPLMGDQHFAGVCHGGAGMLFNIGGGTALRVEYRFYHISEPFDTSDRGLNTHNVLLGISFR